MEDEKCVNEETKFEALLRRLDSILNNTVNTKKKRTSNRCEIKWT